MTKKRKTESKTRKKPTEKMQIKNFQIQTRMGIRQHIQIGILRKETILFIGNLNNNTNEEDLCKHFDLRLTQYLKQNCLVNIPLINKMGKSKGFAFIVTPEKVHQDLGRKILIKEAISTKKKDPK